MRKVAMILPMVIVCLAAADAHAEDGGLTGAAGGAVTGAIVGGPVGAAVGGIAGAAIGTAIDPPPQKVVSYVRAAPAPVQKVTVREHVVVGEPLPQTIVVTPVPDHPSYAYAVIDNERVIVEPSSRKVVQIID